MFAFNKVPFVKNNFMHFVYYWYRFLFLQDLIFSQQNLTFTICTKDLIELVLKSEILTFMKSYSSVALQLDPAAEMLLELQNKLF